MISWQNPTTKMDEEAASHCLNFLIEHVSAERKEVFKHNLDLLKRYVETFKLSLKIPYTTILSKLLSDREREKEAGIYLITIFLVNNLAPWPLGKECQNILMYLLKNIDNINKGKKVLYDPASEAIGMSLRYMKKDSIYTKCMEIYLPKVNKCLSKIIDNDQKLHCISGISKYFPEIVEPHVSYLTTRLVHMQSYFRSMILKVLLAAADLIKGNSNLLLIDFQKLITDNESSVQILTMELILKCIELLTTNLGTILKSIENFIFNKNSSLKNLVFDIFIHVYKTNKSIGESSILKLCKSVLLRGLADNDIDIEIKLLKFWSEESELPKGAQDRYLYILTNLFHPTVEDCYLGYSMFILLNILEQSHQFASPIYDNNLHECVYQEYKPTDWRKRHSTMIPMFVSSQKSHASSSFGSINPNMLLLTLNTREFEPTVIEDQGISNLIENTLKPIVEDFKNPNTLNLSSAYKMKKRIYKDKSYISKQMAYNQVKKGIEKEENRKDLIKQKQHSVKLFRKYHEGEYPDIQIKLSELVKPLQMLLRYDATIAKDVFVIMFDAVFNKTENEFMENAHHSMKEIFKSTIDFSSNLIGALLDIALKHEMQFHPDLITKVSEESGLMSIGSLLLEDYLRNNQFDEPSSSKKNASVDDEETNYWINLANLYKAMDEWDVVSAIFLDKMACKVEVLEAVEAESREKWANAKYYYGKALEVDHSLSRKDFYYESFFKCSAHLSQWQELSETIESTVECTVPEIWNILWTDDWNRRKLLPWYIQANIRNSNDNTETHKELLKTFSEFLKDIQKRDYFKSTYPEEIAFLWLGVDRMENAKVYLNECVTNFIESWTELNPIYSTLRVNKLMKMRNVLDILNFVEQYNKINSTNLNESLKNILEAMEGTNLKSMSLILDETKFFYRNEFIRLMSTKINEHNDLFENLKRLQFQMYVSLCNSAIEQDNFHVAKKYHSKLYPRNSEEELEKALVFSKLLVLKSKSLEGQQHSKLILEAWNSLDAVLTKINLEDGSAKLHAAKHIFDITEHLSTTFTESDMNDEILKRIITLSRNPLLSTKDDVQFHGVRTLSMALDYCERNINGITEKIKKEMGDCYLKLAYVVRNDLRKYETNFIQFVFKAIYFDSVEARQLFPCVLNCCSLENENKPLFLSEASKIPTWIYLQWIPQLLASLDTFATYAVSEILVKIANTYPQAILYPYRLSTEKFIPSNTSYTDQRNIVLGSIKDILYPKYKIVDELLDSLKWVTLPKVILNYYINKLLCTMNDNSKFLEVLQMALNDLYPNVSHNRGEKFKELDKFKESLLQIKNESDNTKIKKILLDIKDAAKRLTNNNKNILKLKDLSPWLIKYPVYAKDLLLEIPGQYSGNRKPFVQYHAKILSFMPQITIFPSLRQPVKISILGSDAKNYSFLVKYGEDLRQDQRLQQIFGVMNGILKADPACNTRRLNLITYNVVPLCSNLGIIKFISGTIVLKEFLMNSSKIDDLKSKYTEFIFGKLKYTSLAHEYMQACRRLKRDAVIPNYNHLVNLIPHDIFRKAFRSTSVNTESFILLRQRFVKSYATMCICNWILGVGDRHLSNILLSRLNGVAIGIDFGLAFGTATSYIDIPELVPFRLTPHILNLTDPLRENGYIQETMIHSLIALIHRKDCILATMNVFLQEPSIDWIDHAKRLSQNMDMKNIWYPDILLTRAKRKLNGVNPMIITIEELRSRNLEPLDVIELYCGYISGDRQYNYRTRCSEMDLIPERQVKCLIDQATDPNLLGRMFHGWESWI